MFPQNNTQNAYLVAKLKSLRTEFLEQGDFERMIEAKSTAEAWQVLNDTIYAKYFGEVKQLKDFDLVLDHCLRDTKKIILKIYAPRKELRFLWLKYDFLNIKSLLKAKLVGEQARLNSLGDIPREDLLAVIKEEEKIELPFGLNALLAEVLQEYEKEKDPQVIDFILDQKFLELFGQKIAKIDSKILSDYLRREIDLFNVKTYFRFKGKELSQEVYIPGGLIPQERFAQAEQKGLIEGVKDLHERNLLKHLAEQVEKEGVISLEREGRRICLDLLSALDTKIMGIEPVFAFWQAKALEVKMIQRIMVLKSAGIKPAEIHRIVGI